MCQVAALRLVRLFCTPVQLGSPHRLLKSRCSACTGREISKKYIIWRTRNGKLQKPEFMSVPIVRKKRVSRARDALFFGLADFGVDVDFKICNFAKRFSTYFQEFSVSRAREAHFRICHEHSRSTNNEYRLSQLVVLRARDDQFLTEVSFGVHETAFLLSLKISRFFSWPHQGSSCLRPAFGNLSILSKVMVMRARDKNFWRNVSFRVHETASYENLNFWVSRPC